MLFASLLPVPTFYYVKMISAGMSFGRNELFYMRGENRFTTCVLLFILTQCRIDWKCSGAGLQLRRLQVKSQRGTQNFLGVFTCFCCTILLETLLGCVGENFSHRADIFSRLLYERSFNLMPETRTLQAYTVVNILDFGILFLLI